VDEQAGEGSIPLRNRDVGNGRAFLLIASLLIPDINPLALAVTGLILVGVLWALVAGGPGIQAAVAVGLVWLMLLGGLRSVVIRTYRSSDAQRLVQYTWLPRGVWFAAWLVIALVCTWSGGRLLLQQG
jgi:peptidase M50B-like protein